MEQKKGLNDYIPQNNVDSEENQRKMKEIELMINANKNITVNNSKLPYLVVALIVVVILLVIIVNSLDKKVDKTNKNNNNINKIK